MKIDAIVLHEKDNVATALRDVHAGEEITVGVFERKTRIQVNQDIPYGHKLAVRPIGVGQDIFKYAEVIGRATQDIRAGAYAHVHNIESLRGRGDWNDRAK